MHSQNDKTRSLSVTVKINETGNKKIKLNLCKYLNEIIPISIYAYIIIKEHRLQIYTAKIIKRIILLRKGYKYFAHELERAFGVSSNTESLLKRGSS